MVRGIRGATTVETNEKEAILTAVAELLRSIVTENQLAIEDIAAVIFSSTPDLNSAFPALAARNIGWNEVPLFGTQEIENPDGVPYCIRVLVLWNTEIAQQAIRHVYLRNAAILRQDISK